MSQITAIYSIVLVFCVIPQYSNCQNTWSITEQFANGMYTVTRNVDMIKKSIMFEIDVETLGFVGFGLSPNGGMEGADIVIGGLLPNGSSYFDDYYASGKQTPTKDAKNDWNVDSIEKNETHTSMKIWRLFETCDAEDVAITENTLNIIWAFGETDEIKYHGGNRGFKSHNLLDPPMPSNDLSKDKTAGIMTLGHVVWWVHTIPPNSENFKTVGHCPTECFSEGLTDDGINVFNVLLHSHLSGRKLKLRHFRGQEELPWLSVDQNYNFDYQQNRHLKKEVKIMKGDHLTYECITDTTWKNGEITIGDLSTRDEMCETFIMYYPKIDMDYCLSSYQAWDLAADFGIDNFTESEDKGPIPVITGPEHMKGKYTDVMTNVVQWTEELRNRYQANVLNRKHDFYCVSATDPNFIVAGLTQYPNVKEYQPENICPKDNSGTIIEKTTYFILLLSLKTLYSEFLV